MTEIVIIISDDDKLVPPGFAGARARLTAHFPEFPEKDLTVDRLVTKESAASGLESHILANMIHELYVYRRREQIKQEKADDTDSGAGVPPAR